MLGLASQRPRTQPFATRLTVNKSRFRGRLAAICFFGILGTASVAARNAPQCHARVLSDEVVVSSKDWYAAAPDVLPPGIIPDPTQWPYFAWSDTPLGVVRAREGDGYLFFGSDGGCHQNCNANAKDSRWGSITKTVGTLDNPLGQPATEPPYEFVFSASSNLPPRIDYVGGGPVYRVPEGEPGAGNLLIVYHSERPANPFWSWLGLARSTDEGKTWQDMGRIIGGTQNYSAQGWLDIGDGGLVPVTDAATSQKYFYIYFPQGCFINSTTPCGDFTYLSVARAPYEQLLTAAFLQEPASVTELFHKYYDGQWNQPGLTGKASELFPGVTGETDGDPEVAWSSYLNGFVAVVDNGQYIALGESADGLYWPPMQKILGRSPETPVLAYADLVGLGDDPGILGQTFYVYFTEWPTGASWDPAIIKRLTVETDCEADNEASSSPDPEASPPTKR